MTMSDLTPAGGVTAPPADEDPRQPEPVEKKQEAKTVEAPQTVVSPYFSNPERLPKALRDLMEADGICEWDIQMAIQAKGYYPADTLIENMDPEFVTGWIIGYWPKVKELIAEIKKNEYIPFN